MEKTLMTVTEVARRLSLGRATTYRLVQQGELPSVRVGRAVRVPVQALDDWVEARTRSRAASTARTRGGRTHQPLLNRRAGDSDPIRGL
jgi:excisionase family DNA binding protein